MGEEEGGGGKCVEEESVRVTATKIREKSIKTCSTKSNIAAEL